jgi:flagellar protein FliL
MAAAKTEEPPAPPAKGEASAGDKAAVAVAAAPAPAGAKSALSSWLPVIAAVLLAPAATWATVEMIVLPRMLKKLNAPAVAAAPVAPAAAEGEGKEKAGKDGPPGYEFENVVVNLSGTMGTRYLKTSFLVTGSDVNIKSTFEGAKPRLTDVTLNVLSSLSLADLEEPGSKNVIRERLVGAYNQALGKKVAEQVYFSDFVIQ